MELGCTEHGCGRGSSTLTDAQDGRLRARAKPRGDAQKQRQRERQHQTKTALFGHGACAPSSSPAWMIRITSIYNQSGDTENRRELLRLPGVHAHPRAPVLLARALKVRRRQTETSGCVVWSNQM